MHLRKNHLACAIMVFAWLCMPSAALSSRNPHCSDFETQPDAQEAFNEQWRSLEIQFSQLDPDGDGVACEYLPSTKQSSVPGVLKGEGDPPFHPGLIDVEILESDEGGSGGIVAYLFTLVALVAIGALGKAAASWTEEDRKTKSQGDTQLENVASHSRQRLEPISKVRQSMNEIATNSSLLRQDANALRMMPYSEYLRTGHWSAIRQDALKRAENRCQVCNSPNNLNVHHRTYERLGIENPEDVTVLCRDCHRLFHENREISKE